MKTEQIKEWEKEFFERFGANTIWSKPSRENVETILDIWSFFNQKLEEQKQVQKAEIISKIYSMILSGEVDDLTASKIINKLR